MRKNSHGVSWSGLFALGMIKRKRTRGSLSLLQKAEKALHIAVAKTIEEHRLSGDPIVVWKNGRVVKIPASKIPRMKVNGRPVVFFVSPAARTP